MITQFDNYGDSRVVMPVCVHALVCGCNDVDEMCDYVLLPCGSYVWCD